MTPTAVPLPPSFELDAGTRTLALDPRDPVFVQDPYPAYRALHARAPVCFWREYGHWCFTRHADVSALLRDRRFGRQVLHVMSRAELGWPEPPAHLAPFAAYERHALLELEPPEHTRVRALVNRPFLARVTERLRPRLEALAHELVDRFAARGEGELLELFATPLPVHAICDVLGVPASLAPRLLAWSHEMVAMYQARRDESVERRAAQATREFSACVRELIAERRRAPGDDLLSALLASGDARERLSEDELASTAMLFLIAGHEATVHGIGNGVKALLEQRVDVRAAFATPDAAARTAEELLRYDTPLHLFTRYALEACEVAGVRLARGERIGLLLGAANHDPAGFDAPERLVPGRWPNPHVSFGGGIHFCVGAPLARLELQVALPLLFERLPGLALTAPARYRDTYHFRGLESLAVRWTRG
jgi:unspecific monooxygenase